MKSKRNIVLLGTDSRDSQAKARYYARAAHELGLGVRRYPDHGTLAVLPCSDFLAVDAARLARAHGLPGPDPLAVTIAGDKSLAYEFLRSRGFRTLFWHVPAREEDLGIPFDGPVIVKPEKGSGSFAGYPWAYRTFGSLRAFGRWLKQRKLHRKFFEYQRRPDSLLGRFFVMHYAPTSLIHAVSAVIGDRKIEECAVGELSTDAETKMPMSMIVGKRHPDAGAGFAMIEALAAAGLRRSVVYLQCIEHEGKLYPIDVNLRTGTLWAAAAEGLDLRLHTRILAFQLGIEARLQFRWPVPYVGVWRMPLPLESGRRRVVFGDGCIPLITELSYDPEKPYDIGHAWPMFAMKFRRYEDFDARADAVMASAEVRRAD
jgi:hypothetical protein